MAITIGAREDDDEVVSTINTTPLVDVMLVLLIIFLITIPVVTHTVPVKLPADTDRPTQTKPQNVVPSIDREGDVYWNQQQLPDLNALLARLKNVSPQIPQPEVHIRGDRDARYEFIGKVVTMCQRAGIAKVGFITQPPPRG
ncbi:MAG TPA: biopolymer transporter ExbD [Stellaceae bacterium]|nr:biopolymer transporter ExbD [Stellaceae bacterium]